MNTAEQIHYIANEEFRIPRGVLIERFFGNLDEPPKKI